MPLAIINGPVIEAGESVSDAVDCSAGDIVRITMPADWTFSNGLTFQISTDGNFFNDLYDHEGQEIAVVVVPGAALIIPHDYLRAAVFLKLRSGLADAPVTQPQARQFAIALEVGRDNSEPRGQS